MTLSTTPLEHIGVEVHGLDLRAPFGEALQQQLRELWYQHGLLLFRNQELNPERQIAFSRLFGPLELHPLKVKTSAEHPELFVLENGTERDRSMLAYYHGEAVVGRLDWHKDLHYTGRPNHGAVLTAVEVPERDGRTGFGDLALAWDALDADTQKLLEQLEVAYAFCMQRRHMRYVDHRGYEPGPHSPRKPSDVGFPDFPDAVYPAVTRHPVTGRRTLEIVEQFLDRILVPHQAGLSNDEAIELLTRLVEHTRNPTFHYFHDWREGDMILWDNWRLMHCATGTPPGVRRIIHRTTIMGDATLGRALTSE